MDSGATTIIVSTSWYWQWSKSVVFASWFCNDVRVPYELTACTVGTERNRVFVLRWKRVFLFYTRIVCEEGYYVMNYQLVETKVSFYVIIGGKKREWRYHFQKQTDAKTDVTELLNERILLLPFLLFNLHTVTHREKKIANWQMITTSKTVLLSTSYPPIPCVNWQWTLLIHTLQHHDKRVGRWKKRQ